MVFLNCESTSSIFASYLWDGTKPNNEPDEDRCRIRDRKFKVAVIMECSEELRVISTVFESN